jgi:hypothetical protein
MLLEALENSGLQTWVDYQSLIPGRPWLEQILGGINAADTVLLVVSKASMASKNVELEYQHALEQKKRVLLLIFEAMPLPLALQKCEWLDFRGSFNKKYKLLLTQLAKPGLQSAPPQSGFKTSFTVLFTVAISLIMAVISIPAWWTIFIPALLIPLPLRILRRDFHFYRVRFVLLTLPLILILSWTFFEPYEFTNLPFVYSWVTSFFITPALLFLLSSKEMRAWGKPGASAPRSVRSHHSEIDQPESIQFFIEHAPEDTKYADAIIKGLKKYGHHQVTDAEQAQVNFAVISRYKNTTTIDPEKQSIFPILVQDTVIESKTLQRIQWIDFRRGLRNLKSLAILLPEPAKLMKALGTVPISGQVVYPRIIQMLDYFLTLLAFFTISIWIPLWLELGQDFLAYAGLIPFLIVNAILTTLILRAVFYARHALVNREGKLASLGWLTASILWIGLIGAIQTIYVTYIVLIVTEVEVLVRGLVIIFLPVSFVIGMVLIGLFGLWNWSDLTRWFPQRQKK